MNSDIQTKTGFLAIVGRPNVGKSTLLNALLGEKVAIVSKKPQTTRNRITGILTKEEKQYVFLDTPGMHRAKTKLGDYMVKSIGSAIGQVDAALLVADASYPPGQTEQLLIERLKRMELPTILVLSKIDLAGSVKLAKCIESYKDLMDYAAVVPVCAPKGRGVEVLLEEAAALLHEGEWLFDENALTDQPERQLAAEIVREKLLRLLSDEIPHGVAVVIEEFKEAKGLLSVRAEIFCERESHKRIIIGKGGEMLKKVGQYAREDLEAFFGEKVYLDLWVKVKENWRDSDILLTNFGYNKKDYD